MKQKKAVVQMNKTDTEPFLYPRQRKAVGKMFNGCILNGGIGPGKSRTGLFYYFDETRYFRIVSIAGTDQRVYIVENPAVFSVLVDDSEWILIAQNIKMRYEEACESGLLFLYLHGTAGVTLSVVLQPIISQILIKWPLMLVFALSQLFCFVKLSCMPFWLSDRLFYRSYIREDLH